MLSAVPLSIWLTFRDSRSWWKGSVCSRRCRRRQGSRGGERDGGEDRQSDWVKMWEQSIPNCDNLKSSSDDTCSHLWLGWLWWQQFLLISVQPQCITFLWWRLEKWKKKTVFVVCFWGFHCDQLLKREKIEMAVFITINCKFYFADLNYGKKKKKKKNRTKKFNTTPDMNMDVKHWRY